MSGKICKWYPVCPMKRFYERGLLAEEWVRDYCFSGWRKCLRYEMEESGEYHSDSMLPDGTIDFRLERYY